MSIFRDRKSVIVSILVFVVGAIPAFAQTTPTISIDTDQFMSAINTWLPMAVQIAAIGVGISAAFALATFVGNMITNAFSGRGSRR